VQYVAVAPDNGVPVRSEESHDLRWYATDALPDDADNAVRSLVARSRDRLRTRD